MTRKHSWGICFLMALGCLSSAVSRGATLTYSSYVGEAQSDSGRSVATDREGNIYFLFQTETPDQGKNAAILKLNSAGTTILYAAILGGKSDEYPNDLAVDKDGNAYVTGLTYSSDLDSTPEDEGFPITEDAYQKTYGRCFISKIDPTGKILLYSTYFTADQGLGIAVDASGGIYVIGTAQSQTPTTPGALQETSSGCSIFGIPFVAKFNPSSPGAASLVYSTFLGGTGCGEGRAIRVDANGVAHITGAAGSEFQVTENAIQQTYGGGMNDAFYARLNSTGSELLYATYLGADQFDSASALALDAEGGAYLTGVTYITFPTTPDAYQKQAQLGNCDPDLLNVRACSEAFVAKITAAGTLAYSTLLGGKFDEGAESIEVDASGQAYLTGRTLSLDFPTQNPMQPSTGGGFDAFLTVLNPAGSGLAFSTYLGGSQGDYGYGLALGAEGRIYLTGETYSTDFPVLNPVQEKSGGSLDAFIAAITLEAASPGLMRGDVNGDKGITVADAILVLRALVGLETLTPEQQKAADADGNGSLNVSDAVRILRVIVGIDPPLTG